MFCCSKKKKKKKDKKKCKNKQKHMNYVAIRSQFPVHARLCMYQFMFTKRDFSRAFLIAFLNLSRASSSVFSRQKISLHGIVRERKMIRKKFQSYIVQVTPDEGNIFFFCLNSGRPLPTMEQNRLSNGRPFLLTCRKAFSHIS